MHKAYIEKVHLLFIISFTDEVELLNVHRNSPIIVRQR